MTIFSMCFRQTGVLLLLFTSGPPCGYKSKSALLEWIASEASNMMRVLGDNHYIDGERGQGDASSTFFQRITTSVKRSSGEIVQNKPWKAILAFIGTDYHAGDGSPSRLRSWNCFRQVLSEQVALHARGAPVSTDETDVEHEGQDGEESFAKRARRGILVRNERLTKIKAASEKKADDQEKRSSLLINALTNQVSCHYFIHFERSSWLSSSDQCWSCICPYQNIPNSLPCSQLKFPCVTQAALVEQRLEPGWLSPQEKASKEANKGTAAFATAIAESMVNASANLQSGLMAIAGKTPTQFNSEFEVTS